MPLAHTGLPLRYDRRMTSSIVKNRPDPKTVVLDALARLRALFPLEARLLAASATTRKVYAQVLAQWLQTPPPIASAFDADALAQLLGFDAVVVEDQGLGCYPFSTNTDRPRVTMGNRVVHAMCAIDALAIARLARTRTRITAECMICAAPIALVVEENGGFDHDQVELARVVWQQADVLHNSCSQGLCRNIRFLCPTCPDPEASQCFSLPQAAAIANAFFRFQSPLVATHQGMRS